MENCIFCKIINNELPSKKIYEDETTLVFLNINPSTNGHLLVIPKKHQVNILDIDDEFILHAHQLIKNILYPKLKEKLNCKGLTIAYNNELGQEIPHFHIHLTPRYEDDYENHTFNKEILKDLEIIYNDLSS